MEGYIFDMDGLLVDTEPLWRKAEIEIFNRIGVPMTEERCKTMMGRRIDDVVNHWFDVYSVSEIDPRVIVLEIQDKMEALIRSGIELLPGIKETLDQLKNKNYPIALASSSSRQLINAVIETTQIADYFQVICSGENEVYSKPHPAIFLTAAKKLNIEPSKLIVFEDSLHGVIAAKAAGMQVIAIPDAENQNNPKFRVADAIVSSIKDLSHEMLYPED